MQLNTIPNRVQRHRSFVYGEAPLVQRRQLALEVEVYPHANSRAKFSVCGRPGPGYDTLPTPRFEFVSPWGMPVFFLYGMRRVDCARCDVRVETVPWAQGKHPLTDTHAGFLATWAKRLSWKAVAEVFHTR
jgi:transposase